MRAHWLNQCGNGMVSGGQNQCAGCLIETHFYSSSYPDLNNLVVAAQYRYVQIHLADGASPTPINIKRHPLANSSLWRTALATRLSQLSHSF